LVELQSNLASFMNGCRNLGIVWGCD
jgi:hypothetical protein